MNNYQKKNGLEKFNINYKLVDFHSDRPGHDLAYRLDPTKLSNLGWSPPINFDKSLEKVVNWTMARQEWLE
jgi:dTDP-glucose 4,6-dehydratase